MEPEDNQNQESETSVESTPETSETPEKKTSMLPMVAVIVLILIVGGYFLTKKPSSSTETDVDTSAPAVTADNPTPSPLASPTGPVKEFTVDGSSFKFAPAVINVKLGDNVKINFKDSDGKHNLVVEGYNVQTDTLETGDQASVTFTADKAGTFAYYCSVDSHRAKGMEGKLIVK